MVFVWSYLTGGDPVYTLVQVSINDLIMLVLFAPIVGFLVAGASQIVVPFQVLFYSVVDFIVIPLALGSATRWLLIRGRGRAWFEGTNVPRFHPVATLALLATLVLIFAFQADNLTSRFFHVLLIAIPILIQVCPGRGASGWPASSRPWDTTGATRTSSKRRNWWPTGTHRRRATCPRSSSARCR